MKKNVGKLDKVIRTVVGLFLLSMLFWVEGDARFWGLLGIPVLFTILTGRCYAYNLIGVNTCKNESGQ